MVGTQAVALIGSYDTMELAVAGWNGQSLTATSPQDHIELIIEPGIGKARYHLISIEVD